MVFDVLVPQDITTLPIMAADPLCLARECGKLAGLSCEDCGVNCFPSHAHPDEILLFIRDDAVEKKKDIRRGSAAVVIIMIIIFNSHTPIAPELRASRRLRGCKVFV